MATPAEPAAGGAADEEHGEQRPLVQHEPFDYQKHATAMVAQSKLRSTTVAMLMCIAIFVGLLTARLELQRDISWPVYVDSLPLWLVPLLLYLTAADFAATRISSEAALGKVVVVTSGFFVAVCLLVLTLFVMMKLTFVVTWPWTLVMSPIWGVVFMAQFFLCFLIPGFLRADQLKGLLRSFVGIWMAALTVLLISLKLDGELPHWYWMAILIPTYIMLLLQVELPNSKNFVDVLGIVVLFAVAVMFGLQLDQIIKWPWVAIFGPIMLLIILNIVTLCGMPEGE